jgi:hypothetical protein
MIEKLRSIYSLDTGWVLATEVRSATGRVEGLRVADAVAVSVWPSMGLEIHGFELKVSRKDWQAELAQPAKAREIGRFCSRWYLVVPAPWKNVVTSLSELPEGWGLITIGTGGAEVVREAEERQAQEPTPAFLQALLRAGARGSAVEGTSAPLVRITRPHLSRTLVGLACGHTAPAPMAKKMPLSVQCWSCAEGRPSDLEMVRAFLEEASPEVLAEVSREVEERLGVGAA